MSPAEYIKLAHRTAPDDFRPAGIIMALNAQDAGWFDLVHAALGVHGEADELDQAQSEEDIIKEVGDLLWYCALATKGIKYETAPASNWFEIILNYREKSFVAPAEIVKKAMFYGTRMDPNELVHSIFQWAARAIHQKQKCGGIAQIALAIDVAMKKNIEKLQRRYPEKFDTALAQTHDSQ